MDTNVERVIVCLENNSREWRDYSGRGMYGKSCLGVTIDSLNELFDLGVELSSLGLRPPSLDNMGLKYIAYWPHLKFTKEDLIEINKE